MHRNTIGREVLVLVSLGYRRCYCSGGALFLFFPVCRRQGRIIQHSALAGDPCRFGRRGWRQRLVALGRTARCCDHSSPPAGGPGSSVRAVLTSHLDSPARLSLTGATYRIIGIQIFNGADSSKAFGKNAKHRTLCRFAATCLCFVTGIYPYPSVKSVVKSSARTEPADRRARKKKEKKLARELVL